MPGFLPSPPLGRVREITPEDSGGRWPPYTVLAIQSDSGIHPLFSGLGGTFEGMSGISHLPSGTARALCSGDLDLRCPR